MRSTIAMLGLLRNRRAACVADLALEFPTNDDGPAAFLLADFICRSIKRRESYAIQEDSLTCVDTIVRWHRRRDESCSSGEGRTAS